MFGKMNYNASVIQLPAECLFPKTADALILQAKAFTGKEIVMDPHWRAAPSLWLDADGRDLYREWLNKVQKEENRTYAAFVFYRDDLGAYIVYADHGDRWDGSLSSGEPKDNDMADTLCHEIAHLLTDLDANKMSTRENKYFNEQCAVFGGAMLKTAIGARGIVARTFPQLKPYQPPHIRNDMDYDSFCIYTPSPLARYFETSDGHAAGMGRYLSPSGIVRFDIASEGLARSALHLRHHLSAMQLFGDVALEIANNRNFDEQVTERMPGAAAIKTAMATSPRDEYAKKILKHWWQAALSSLDSEILAPVQNIYVGGVENFPSIYHADSYFLNLGAVAQRAMTKLPNDYLLPIIFHGITSMMTNVGHVPTITSRVTARCEDHNLPQKRENRGLGKRFIPLEKAGCS